MRKAFLLVLPLLFLLVRPAAAQEVVVVLSGTSAPYREIADDFRACCLYPSLPTGGIRSVAPLDLNEIVVADRAPEEVAASIRELRPDLILAVGNPALQAAALVERIPIVYLLVARPELVAGSRTDLTGIVMHIPARLQFAAIRRHLPGVRRLGVVYDPSRVDALITEARRAAPAQGIELIATAVDDDRKVPAALTTMRGKIDALWLLPDMTVVQPATLKDLALFSLESRLPIIAFADKYLLTGAAMAITFDFRAMARQAGEIVSRILAGTAAAAIAPQHPDAVSVHLNDRIIGKLAIPAIKPAPRSVSEGGP